MGDPKTVLAKRRDLAMCDTRSFSNKWLRNGRYMVGKWLIDGNVKNWWIVIITTFFCWWLTIQHIKNSTKNS